MSDVSKLVGPDNTSYDILSKTTRGIVRATMESTSTSTAFVITAPGINSLYDGATFICKNTIITSATNCTIQVNSLTAKRIWLSQSNSYCTTHWGLNQTYIFVFDNTNDRWELQQGRDTNDNTLPNSIYYWNNTYAKSDIVADRMIVGDENGYTTALPNVSFNISYPILWTTGALSNGAQDYSHQFEQIYDRTLANIKSDFVSTAKKMIYLVVTVSGITATIDSTLITDSLPSTEDGKVYITLGRLGAQSNGKTYFHFQISHPMYEFKNGSLNVYIPNDTSKMDKVNPTGSGSFSLNRKANTTIGDNSFAEGTDNTASGEASHAEGYSSIASGNVSHAEGRTCTASKLASHAEGYHTTSDGLGAHSEGEYTIASSRAQHASGKYNIEDANGTYAEIVGNGTAIDARSNARTLDWDGNEVLYGTTSPTLNLVAKAPDLTKSNNNVSADTHSGTYYQDVNGKAMAKITGVAYTDGRTGLELYAKNWNTSGTDQGSNALSLYIDKSGNKTVGVNAPQAWLDALTRTTPSTSPQNVFNLIGRDGVVDHTIRYFLINCSSSLNGFKIVIELPSNNWGKYRFETIGTANRTYFHNEVFVTTNGSSAIDACGYRDLNSTFTTASGCDAISTTYLTWTVDKVNRKLTSNMIPKYGMCMVMCHCGTAISSLVKVTTIESN